MIEINQPKIIAEKQIIGEPQIHITGESADNSRMMTVNYIVKDEHGEHIETITKTFTGKEFNDMYEQYQSDKAIMKKTLDLPVDNLPDNFNNVL